MLKKRKEKYSLEDTKVAKPKTSNSSNVEEDDEKIAMISRRFNKFLQKERNMKNKKFKKSYATQKDDTKEVTCYNCKNQDISN